MLILDELVSGLKDVCSAFPDKRKGGDPYLFDGRHRAVDVLAVFHVQKF